MTITITIISILFISVLAWLARRILSFTVCPICVGVCLTWIWLLGAHLLGYEIDLIVPALLMGGSVVGIMYKIEKKFNNLPADQLLLWKILFVPAGFIAAYAVLEQLWMALLLAIAFLFLLSFALLSSREESASEIEKKMKDCC